MTKREEKVKSIMKEIADSGKFQSIIDNAGQAVRPHLSEGKTYYSAIFTTKYGTQGGTGFTIENGEKKDVQNNKIYNSLQSENMLDITREFPENTKIRLTMEKGAPLLLEASTIPMLLEDIILEFKSDYFKDTRISSEALISFLKAEDEVEMDVEWTEVDEENIFTDDYCVIGKNEIKCISALLDDKIEKLHLLYKEGTLTIETTPAFPEYGFREISVTSIESEGGAAAERKKAAEEAIALRYDFYSSLGKLHDDPVYLSVGGFSEYEWPGSSTSKTMEKLRVIYTKTTTILITDGLSDIYRDEEKDEKLQYNGLGIEFYVEFDSILPFEKVKYHYMAALLNSMTQVAIGHGEMKEYMTGKKIATIEFTIDNVNTYAVKGNYPTEDISSFFPGYSEHVGLLLGMESASVPKTMKLNKEEVLLVNAKPFGEKWFTKEKLKSSDEAVIQAAQKEMVRIFNESDQGNLIPETYQADNLERIL